MIALCLLVKAMNKQKKLIKAKQIINVVNNDKKTLLRLAVEKLYDAQHYLIQASKRENDKYSSELSIIGMSMEKLVKADYNNQIQAEKDVMALL